MKKNNKMSMEKSKKSLIEKRLGRVILEPSGPGVAGAIGRWKLVYTAGSYGVDF